jgi:hypothetical protein
MTSSTSSTPKPHRKSNPNGHTSQRQRNTEPRHQDSYTLDDHGYFNGNTIPIPHGHGSGGRVPETPMVGGSMDLHVRVKNGEQFWQGKRVYSGFAQAD